MSTRLEILAPHGAPEIRAEDDLAGILLSLVEVVDGDIVAVTSKVVAKAEGRVRTGDRDTALADETVRTVARRGATSIVRTRHGLTLAAAGIDASNVEAGHVVLLPEDPDRSARGVRASILDRTGTNVAVVVTDTAGRPWREGQTDIAVGAAGLRVLEDFAGRVDGHGNELAVTAPAVADEIAGAVELAQGKLGGRPFAVVRGRADLVLPAGEDGAGARALVRPDGGDMFGYGTREAVVRALRGDPVDQAPFGAPAPPEELVAAWAQVGAPGAETTATGVVVRVPAAGPIGLRAVAFAHGWREVLEDDSTDRLRFRRATP